MMCLFLDYMNRREILSAIKTNIGLIKKYERKAKQTSAQAFEPILKNYHLIRLLIEENRTLRKSLK